MNKIYNHEHQLFMRNKDYRKQNVYSILSKTVSNKEPVEASDKRKYYDTLVNRFFDYVSKSYNLNLIMLVNNLPDEDIAKIVLSSLEDKTIANTSSWMSLLKNSKELYLNEMIDGSYNESVQQQFKNDLKNEIQETNNEFYADHLTFVLTLFNLLQCIPSSQMVRRLFPPHSCILREKEIPFLSLFTYYYESIYQLSKSLDSQNYFYYIFAPYDLFMNLFINSSYDLIKIIDNCFDFLCLTNKTDIIFKCLKINLEALINKYKNKINKLKIPKVVDLDTYDCLNIKQNRDLISQSLSFLFQVNNTPIKYNVLNKNILTQNEKREFYYEKPTKSSSFSKNLNLIQSFLNTYPFFVNQGDVNNGLPIIGLLFENESILLEKVLYREFILKSNDHKKHPIHGQTKSKNDSLLTRDITTIIQLIIQYINNTHNISNMNIPNSGIFNTVTPNFAKNDRNIDLYTLSIYFTEKIRRGYYREYLNINWYKVNFEIGSELKIFFDDLFHLKSYIVIANILYGFSKDLINLILKIESISDLDKKHMKIYKQIFI